MTVMVDSVGAAWRDLCLCGGLCVGFAKGMTGRCAGGVRWVLVGLVGLGGRAGTCSLVWLIGVQAIFLNKGNRHANGLLLGLKGRKSCEVWMKDIPEVGHQHRGM